MKQLKKENVFISSVIHSLKNVRETIRLALIKRGYGTVMSEENDFPIDANKLKNMHSHDYCIDKLLECESMIFIFGENSGGKYSGIKYKNYCDEIFELSEGKVKEPSISIVELYVAIKNNILHYAFIDSKFDDLDYRQSNWEDNAIKEYNFLTHIKDNGLINNNWISGYSNVSDLEIRVRNLVL